MAKTVGSRLRGIHSNDVDLLEALHAYSGYMVARGYEEVSVKYHLANMAIMSRLLVLKGDYRPKFVVPLVSSLYPATTVLSKVVKSSFSRASSGDSVIDVLLPSSSLFVSFTRLPNLQLLLCPNDQNKLATTGPPNPVKGYTYTECNCLVCQASHFSPWVSPPPSMS